MCAPSTVALPARSEGGKRRASARYDAPSCLSNRRTIILSSKGLSAYPFARSAIVRSCVRAWVGGRYPPPEAMGGVVNCVKNELIITRLIPKPIRRGGSIPRTHPRTHSAQGDCDSKAGGRERVSAARRGCGEAGHRFAKVASPRGTARADSSQRDAYAHRPSALGRAIGAEGRRTLSAERPTHKFYDRKRINPRTQHTRP